MKIGGEPQLGFCKAFIASHNPYDPELLAPPVLDDTALAGLRLAALALAK